MIFFFFFVEPIPAHFAGGPKLGGFEFIDIRLRLILARFFSGPGLGRAPSFRAGLSSPLTISIHFGF